MFFSPIINIEDLKNEDCEELPIIDIKKKFHSNDAPHLYMSISSIEILKAPGASDRWLKLDSW